MNPTTVSINDVGRGYGELILDTRNAVSNSPDSCTFFLGNINQQHSVYQLIGLDAAIIPNTRFPININNYTVAWLDNATPQTGTLTAGYYTGTTLAAAILVILDAGGTAGHAVAYDTGSGLLTITAAAGTTITLTSNAFATFIGVTAGTASSVGGALTAYGPVRIDGPEYVDIRTTVVGSNQVYTSGNNNTSMVRVPLYGGYGTVAYHTVENIHFLEFPSSGLRQIQIQLFDPDGNAFTLPINCQCSYTFRLK